MPEQPRRKVVVTGAAGNLGGKIGAFLDDRVDLELVRLDRNAAAADRIVAAELSVPGAWAELLAGADTVVHLAANPNERASWSELVVDNIDATQNVFEAAVAAGVRRVVFVSSLHVLLGYEGHRIATDLPPCPINFYGASKAIGERLAERLTRQHGISVICLRIGMVRRGENAAPIRHPSLATQWRWLSNRDFCRALALAIDAGPIPFGVAGVTSAVAGSPWSLEESRQLLGFEPMDTYRPVPAGLGLRLRRRLRRAFRRRH